MPSEWASDAAGSGRHGGASGAAPPGAASSHAPAATRPNVIVNVPEPPKLIRPYAITGGRTRTRTGDLALEAMVMTTQQGHGASVTLAFERRAIVELCAEPQAVADVASKVRVPLGVARVLIGDLVADGYLSLPTPSGGSQLNPRDVGLLERVLHGLHEL